MAWGPRLGPQFIYGSPMIGFLSQSGVFKSADKDLKTLLQPEIIPDDSAMRYRPRAARPDTSETASVWGESLELRDFGCLDGPLGLTASGRIASDSSLLVNIAPRPARDSTSAHTSQWRFPPFGT